MIFLLGVVALVALLIWLSFAWQHRTVLVGGLVVLAVLPLVISAVEAKRRAGYVYEPGPGIRNPLALPASPERALRQMVETHGGVPLSKAYFHPGQGLESTAREPLLVSSFRDYRIVRVEVRDGVHPTLAQALADEDPTTGVTALVELTGSSGTKSHYTLSTWRYGLFLGWLFIPYGDGPGWTWEPADPSDWGL